MAHRQGASMPNLRLALRMLFRTPVLTAIAILSLAIGIGANAAIFSLFNQMLMRPLPVRDPYGLVNLGAPGPKPGSQSSTRPATATTLQLPDVPRPREGEDEVQRHRRPPHLRARTSRSRGRRRPARGCSSRAATSACSASRRRPDACSASKTTARRGRTRSSVLSHGYWQTRFAMSPAVIGDTLIINGQCR